MIAWRRLVEHPPTRWIVVVAGLRILLWLVFGMPTVPGFSRAAFLSLVLAFAGASAILLWGGYNREPRARALALTYLLVASTYTDWRHTALPSPPEWLGFTMRSVQPHAFLPFAIWAFCSQFPRAPQFPREVRRLENIRFAAWAAGVLLFAVNLVPRTMIADTFPSFVSAIFQGLNAYDTGRGFWRLIGLMSLPAIIVAVLRTRRAPVDERRRVAVMLWGILLGGVPPLVMPLIVGIVPSLPAFDDPKASLLYMFIEYGGLLAMLAASAYAILARRALDLRFLVRRTIQYALARNAILAATAVPFIALAVIAYRNRSRPMNELFANTELAMLVGFTVTGLALTRLRVRARARIDRLFFREDYDARQILASLVDKARTAPDSATLARLCSAEIDRALHVDRVALLYNSPRRPLFVSAMQNVRPLAADSSLMQQLGGEDAYEVEWEPPSGLVAALQPEDRRWLADSDFRLLLPVRTSHKHVIGLLGLGEKRSELPYSKEDKDLLKAIAGAAGLVLENRMLVEDGTGPAPPVARERALDSAFTHIHDEAVGYVCSVCTIVQESKGTSCEHCGGVLEPREYPLLLAGKYELMQRIGRGGMGIVFRARDRVLGRDVAIKTLPDVGAERAARLRREARAVAALTHPNLAVILAAEVWRGTPYLVFEYLPGGTLADLLRKGALHVDATIALGITLADVLERIHGARILHRDVKPANIGFAADGTPKLLDFGLARLIGLAQPSGTGRDTRETATRAPGSWTGGSRMDLTQPHAAVGTLPYLSPEALNGEAPAPSFDIWSMHVVLYECVAGDNPFIAKDQHATITSILGRDVPDIRSFRPDASSRFATYLSEALAREPRRRPQTAREARDRLQRIAVRAA